MRKVMSHMFAQSAVAAEEPLVQRYVDKMIERLRERAVLGEEVDMVMWYKYGLAVSLLIHALQQPNTVPATLLLIYSALWPSTKTSDVLKAESFM